MILENLKLLEDYIQEYTIDSFEKVGINVKLKITVYLKNHSILFIKEIHVGGKRKYAYHWQDKNEELICRWDNAPDWPSIQTYPHHKHEKGVVKESYEIEAEGIFHAMKKHIQAMEE